MDRKEYYYTTPDFEIEEFYGYYLAKPVGEFRDAFGERIEFEVIFEVTKGEITHYEVCETTEIWGNIYWSEKVKTYPHNRMFIKNLRNCFTEKFLKERKEAAA